MERYRRHTAINLRLSFYTLECVKEIREETGVGYDLMQKGTLKIHTNPWSLSRNHAECETLKSHGMVFEVADAKRCVEIEPALEPIAATLVGGLYFPGVACSRGTPVPARAGRPSVARAAPRRRADGPSMSKGLP